MRRIVSALATLLCASAAMSLSGQTFTTVFSFDLTDGGLPFAGLVQGSDGNLYGTTQAGGTTLAGTTFKITAGGALTKLHTFCSQSGCADGDGPQSNLLQGSNGTFYGTTYSGGANDKGTVFKMTAKGKVTTLHSFAGSPTDGANPYAGLIQATNGDFYGTTGAGGAGPGAGAGAVFKMTPNGTLTTIYSFCTQTGCPDGEAPYAELVQASNGNLYGTTASGGAHFAGTIFEITPAGVLTTIYNFCSLSNCTDGIAPRSALIQGTDGELYGTTVSSAAPLSAGTVFKVTLKGALTTLYTFCAQTGCSDGKSPYAGLVQGTDGNFYGMTYIGGDEVNTSEGGGTLFKITPSGVLTTLKSFCSDSNCTDGVNPLGGVMQATNGDFYGMTTGGGAKSEGTVFSLSESLGAFVETQPTSGKVGAAVKILGTDLTGATSVSFNGTEAVFTVVSSSEISTTVPSGASTGKVKVVTPAGTLSSNISFRVP